jgi:predicted GNAT family N-acyltransferase
MKSDNLQIGIVRSVAEMEDALSVRRAVFIEEQGVFETEEIDAYDGDPKRVTSSIHVIAYLDGRPVATGRLLLDALPGQNAYIGRVAVLREYRGCGLGRMVMLALQKEAQCRGYFGITVAAQLHAIRFYESLGYSAYGDVFLDAGIEHRLMDLSL